MVRLALCLAGVCLLAAGGAFWLLVIDPAQRHRDFCQSTQAELQSLAHKRPPGVSRQQWESVVAWTLNGHGNILTFKQDIPQPDRDKFLAELRARLAGPVDLDTVDWVWDEFERLCPSYGPIYSGRYRPTSPERLREFETPGSGWNGSWGIKVD